MRNKVDLDTLSMDDLYNNLKVYEVEIKGQSSSNSNSQNVAFVSSENTSSANKAVNTAHDVSAASLQGQASSSTYADDVMFSFFANQSNSPQLDNKDLEQIDTDDLKRWISNGRASRNQGNRYRENTRRAIPEETPANALVVTDGMGYQLGFESLEARLVVHQKNEAVYEEDIAFLKYDVQVKDISIKELKNQLEEALKEKDDLKLNFEKFETSSKNLTDLLNSQISVNNKTGIGFNSQINENEIHMNKSKVFESASDSSVNESEEDNYQVNDRFKKVEGYYAVPPPYTRNFKPPRLDLSFAGLDDFVFKSVVSETVTIVHESETSASKTSKENMEKSKTVRSSAPIIEDWEQAENLRKSQTSRVDKRYWNEMMTQKLEDGFEFKKKSCFVCGSLNHLIKDCNFYENKMVGKFVLNKEGKGIGQREVRPVWNNAQRVNHRKKLSHPQPKRNFVPTAVLTKSGKGPVNTAKQSFTRAAVSNSTTKYVNIAATRPTVNGSKSSSNVFHKSHSPVKRTFDQRTAPKNSDLKEKVNTAKVNNVTTAGPKAVVSVVQGHDVNAIKSSTCWIWRPTRNVIDHISKDSGSYMLKRFDYVDP
ncbi:hypothetical protein Tco_0317039 [Tanacetum coccineum]